MSRHFWEQFIQIVRRKRRHLFLMIFPRPITLLDNVCVLRPTHISETILFSIFPKVVSRFGFFLSLLLFLVFKWLRSFFFFFFWIVKFLFLSCWNVHPICYFTSWAFILPCVCDSFLSSHAKVFGFESKFRKSCMLVGIQI